MAEDDVELMVRYASGDSRAFATLYARHRMPLYRYVARLVRDREAADDLFQEVWSRIIAHRESYEPRAQFSTYLYRVARNCCIDHLRRAAARPGRGLDTEAAIAEDPALALTAPDADSPEKRLECAELLACYRATLESLPLEQRDAFLLAEQSGLTLEEIASITGVGLETAKSRVRYALAKLRKALTAVCADENSRITARQRVAAAPVAAPIESGAAALHLAGEPST